MTASIAEARFLRSLLIADLFPLLGRFPAGVEKGAQVGAPLLAELPPDERELWEDGHTVQSRKSDADLSAI